MAQLPARDLRRGHSISCSSGSQKGQPGCILTSLRMFQQNRWSNVLMSTQTGRYTTLPCAWVSHSTSHPLRPQQAPADVRWCCAGAQVTAGTVNCEGSMWVEVQQAGQATFLAHLAQAVEAAQGRAPPVQRLADAVAGRVDAVMVPCCAAGAGLWARSTCVLTASSRCLIQWSVPRACMLQMAAG